MSAAAWGPTASLHADFSATLRFTCTRASACSGGILPRSDAAWRVARNLLDPSARNVAENAYPIEHGTAFSGSVEDQLRGPANAMGDRMPMQGKELERRAANLAAAIKGLSPAADSPVRAHKLLAAASKHSEQVESGYRHACASSSPDEFTRRISEVAAHARRTKALLMLLVQLGYVPLDDIRELIIEARGLENIFVASRNTAKRRLRRRVNQPTRGSRPA